MIKTAIVTLEINPQPSHKVRTGASANTGIAWLNTSIGRKNNLAVGESSSCKAVATPNKCESGKENQSRNTNSINTFSPDDVDLAFCGDEADYLKAYERLREQYERSDDSDNEKKEINIDDI